MAADKAAPKPLNKSQIYDALADKTKLTKKQVGEFFGALEELVKQELNKRGGAKAFVIPGLMKLQAKKIPAKKATRKPNPFKPGEMMDVKAKPASTKVTVRPLKNLKDLVK